MKTPWRSPLRLAAYGILLVILACLAHIYFNGPERLVMKYDTGGEPLRNADRFSYVIFYLVYLAFVNAVLGVVMFVFRKPENLNRARIFHKEHWMKPENQAEGVARLNLLLDVVLIFVHLIILIFILAALFEMTGPVINWLVFAVMAGAGALIFASFRLFKP